MSDPIELEVTEILQNMGIAKIHRTLDSNNNPILIIIPKDTTNYKTLQFEIDEDPEAAAYSCESACRDFLDLKIISALQIFVTDNWDKIIPPEEEEGGSAGEGGKKQQPEKISHRSRYTDTKNNILYESILVDGKAVWLTSKNGVVDISKGPIILEADTKNKSKIEPISQEDHQTKAYSFKDEEEVSATSTSFDKLDNTIKKIDSKYIDADDYHVSMLTVSVIFTYFQDRVGTTHYLFFVGPPNCGKTNNLTLIQEMGYRCMGSTGMNVCRYLHISRTT